MTCYSTNTESESYEAADLARIALQAAIDAVDAYQARNGVCDAPFRCTLHVDNGNEADREVSGPDEYHPIRELLDRSVPDGVKRYYDSWTGHDGSDDCPVPRDCRVEAQFTNLDNNIGSPSIAGHMKWRHVSRYRVVEDA